MRVAIDGDAVLVHYKGYLDDGSVFDTSYERKEPLNFVIGGGDVIRGFDDVSTPIFSSHTTIIITKNEIKTHITLCI